MSDANEEYIPALSYRFLTPFYDFIQKYIVRDVRYKSLLIDQADIRAGSKRPGPGLWNRHAGDHGQARCIPALR